MFVNVEAYLVTFPQNRNMIALSVMYSYFMCMTRYGRFPGGRKTTLPAVLNDDVKRVGLGMKLLCVRDLDKLKLIASSRDQWRTLSARVIASYLRTLRAKRLRRDFTVSVENASKKPRTDLSGTGLSSEEHEAQQVGQEVQGKLVSVLCLLVGCCT